MHATKARDHDEIGADDDDEDDDTTHPLPTDRQLSLKKTEATTNQQNSKQCSSDTL